MRRKKSKRKSRLITGLLLMINIGLVLLLIAAYAANHISPEKVWQIAFAGLAFPFVLFANLLMILLWVFIRPRYALLSLITIAAGFNIAARHFQLNYPDEFEKGNRHIRVSSFNAHFYDIWDESGKPQYGMLESITGFFATNKPDILCFQEGVIHHERTGNIADRVRSQLEYQHVSMATYYPGGHSGLLIYHNGKVLNEGKITHNSRTIAIYTDIEVRGNPVRVYSIHLQSNMLGEEEYVIDNLTPDAYKDTLFLIGSKNIARKLKHAFIKRAQQAELLHAHIETAGLPVIICGDLNDTPSSYAYHTCRSGLRDAFMKAGKGMGRTYRGKFPSFRIDYIFTSKSIKVKSFTTEKQKLSDHHPVTTWLELPELQE